MTKPVIVPTDFSEHSAAALEWARKMCQALDAPMHCVYVAREASMYLGTEFAPGAIPSVEDIKQSADDAMARFVAEHDMGTAPKTVVLFGTPFVEIVRYARDQSARMIVMSTHGHSGLKHMLLGSTAESVVRKATCPVLTVPSPGVWFELP